MKSKQSSAVSDLTTLNDLSRRTKTGLRITIGCHVVVMLFLLSALIPAVNVSAPLSTRDSGGGGEPLGGNVLLPYQHLSKVICGAVNPFYIVVGVYETSEDMWTSRSILNSPYNGQATVEHVTTTYTKLTAGPFGFVSEKADGYGLQREDGAIGAYFMLATWSLYSIWCIDLIHPLYNFDTGRDTAWVTDWEPLGTPYRYFTDLMGEGTKSHKFAPKELYKNGYWSHEFDVSYDSMEEIIDTVGSSGLNQIIVRGANNNFLQFSIGVRFRAFGVDLGGLARVYYESGILEEDKYVYTFYPDGIWYVDYLNNDRKLRAFSFEYDPPPPPPPPDDDDNEGGRPRPPDCVWVAPWNGTDYVDDNNLLPSSVTRNYSSNFSFTDYYMLQEQLVSESGLYKMRLREFVEQRNNIDVARLWAVYHSQDSLVVSTSNGNLLSFSPLTSAPFEAKNSTGGDVLNLVASLGDGKSYRAKTENDYVTFKFYKSSYPATGRLLVRSQMFYPPIKKPKPIGVGDGDMMQHVGDIQPRANWHNEGFDIGDYLPGGEPMFFVNISLPKGHRLDYVGFDESIEEFIEIEELPLLRALDHYGSVITNELATADRDYSYLRPYENITLEFDGYNLSSPNPGETVNYRIALEGFYLPQTHLLSGEAGRIFATPEGQDIILTPYVTDYDGYTNVTWWLDNETTPYISDILRLDQLESGEHFLLAFINFTNKKILLSTHFEVPYAA